MAEDHLFNSCEGTSGVAVSISNSAGPTQFDAATVTGTGATQTWDNTHAHTGVTSMKNSLPAAVAASAFVDWTTKISPTPVANAFARFYVYITAYPSIATRLCAFSNGATVVGSLQLNTAGTIRTINTAGSQVGITTAVVPLNAWCRIEFDCSSDTGTTVTLAARMFSAGNLETNTPDSGGSISNTGNTTSALSATMRTGETSATQTSVFNIWFDDIGFSDTVTPGPLLVSRPGMLPNMPVTVVSNAGWRSAGHSL